MHNTNLISIVIPVFNGAKYISKALDSVFNQNYTPIEVIVIDDGSTDKSSKIIKSYDVRYIKQDNLGVAAARNNGINIAKGKFLTFLDQDDTWLQNKLTSQIEYFKTHQNLGYVLSNQIIFLEKGLKKPKWVKEEQLNTPIIGYLPSTLMVREDIFKKVGYFDINYKLGSDSEWFFRAKEKNIEMEIMPEVLVHRLIHDSNHSHSVGDSHIELLKMVRQSILRKRLK